MDAIAQLKTSVYSLLTQDAEMQALFPDGEVLVENVWPEPDQKMPYIVYRATSTPASLLDIAANATLTIDLWDFNSDGSRIAGIRQRVCKLFDGKNIEAGGVLYRMRKTIDQEMEEDEKYAWHITMSWQARYTRQEELDLED